MAHKDEIAMRKTALLKAARSMVRLRHSLEADVELNDVLPSIERDFDAQVQTGVLPEIAALIAGYIE